MNQKKKKREAQITHLLFTHSAAKRGENFLFSWRGPTSHPDPVLRVKRLLHGNNRARLDSFSLRQIRRSYIYIPYNFTCTRIIIGYRDKNRRRPETGTPDQFPVFICISHFDYIKGTRCRSSCLYDCNQHWRFFFVLFCFVCHGQL